MELSSDQTFEGATLNLDDRSFVRCTFRNCEFWYSGGDWALVECQLQNCSLKLFGPADRSARLLQLFGWSYSPPHERLG